MDSKLIGYVRKSKAGGAINMSVDIKAFKDAVKQESYESEDGRKFVRLVVNSDKMSQILAGDREVTSISQIISEDTPADDN